MKDLKEVFNGLRKHRIKFNPEKCMFYITVEKFLRFMVSQKRIKANLEKIKAIIDMQLPSVIIVQRLIGIIAAIYFFMSKSTDTFFHF